MAVATIKDVAARAGVSVMTVSRVLNGERRVAEAMRERVQAAVAELDFRRNPSARGLPGAQTFVLALVAQLIPSYVAELERGAIGRCRLDDYHLAVVSTDPAIDDPAQAMKALIATLRADGLILLPPLASDPAVLEVLEAAGRSYARVAPDDDFARAPSVRIDDVAAADEMTRHLLDLGHRRIGFVAGPINHGGSARRYQGYLQALARRGLAADAHLVHPGDFSFDSGLTAAAALLGLEARPTAIFASNDNMALGVMSAASRAGLAVPEDLAVAGFDDSEGARRTWPMLTTIRQPAADFGWAAAEMLIARAGRRGPRPPSEARLFAYELMARGSTQPGWRPGDGEVS